MNQNSSKMWIKTHPKCESKLIQNVNQNLSKGWIKTHPKCESKRLWIYEFINVKCSRETYDSDVWLNIFTI